MDLTKAIKCSLKFYYSLYQFYHLLILNFQSSPDDTACIILEPVLGEGGIYSIEEDFLKYVRKICTQHNIILILDEVQCGIGRSGKLFAHEWSKIKPDLLSRY